MNFLFKRTLVSVLFFSFFIFAMDAFSANGPLYKDGQVVVKGEPWEFDDFEVIKYYPNAGLTVLKVDSGKEFGQIQKFRDKKIKANLNFVVKAISSPNDPYYTSYQWNLPAVQAEQAWNISTGKDSTGTSVIVAVLDTGLYPGGPDGISCVVPGYDSIDSDYDPLDGHYHGTHVSGTIAQTTNNLTGAAGLAYDSCIMPVRVLDDDGSGDSASLADGIIWAYNNGARVLNMSLGFGVYPLSLFVNDPTYDALNFAPPGVTLVAASGNNSSINGVSYPASHPEVIAVGATNSSNNIASFSNQGSDLNLVAPGVSVLQETYVPARYLTNPNNEGFGYYQLNGTSMASPHVAAAAAMLIAQDSGLDRSQVLSALESTAVDLGDSGFDSVFGHGLIQVADALQTVTSLLPPPVVSLKQPTSLQAVDNTNGTATLSWSETSENEDGFQVQRRKWNTKRNKAGSWTIIAVLGPNTTTYPDNESGAGTFDYQVRAYAGNDVSVWSGLANVVVTEASSKGGGGNNGKGKNNR